MNYIDQIALDIAAYLNDTDPTDKFDMRLYRMYALLVLVRGIDTTREDVHDAWSAWRTDISDLPHPSLIPFDQLSPEVQALDEPYVEAIREVARDL